LLLEHPPRSYWLQVLHDVKSFEPPFDGTPYPCLLWDTRAQRSSDDIRVLTRALIASNCRNGVCGGLDCDRWHDGLDEAFLNQRLSKEEEESRFVLTTWHTDESPDDVAFFFVHNTNFDDHDFKQFLVVQIGSDWTTEQALTEALREHATAPDDEEDDDEEEEDWRETLPNKRLKLAARVDCGMSLSSARRSLSAIR
jgi:hypothetical protein